MKIWKLFCVAMVVAVLASVVAFQPASAQVATSPAPKVTVLALPFAVKDTGFPVLVLIKNASADSSLEKVEVTLSCVPNTLTLDYPEKNPVKMYWSIRPKGYGFTMWFVESPELDGTVITITATVVGKIGGAAVSGSDSMDITVYEL